MPSPDSMSSLTLPSQATGTGIGLRFQLRVTETQPRLARADVGIDQFMPGGGYLQVGLHPAAQCPQKASLSLSTTVLDSGKCPATMCSNTDLPIGSLLQLVTRNSWSFLPCPLFPSSCLLYVSSCDWVLGTSPGSVSPDTAFLPRCVYSALQTSRWVSEFHQSMFCF